VASSDINVQRWRVLKETVEAKVGEYPVLHTRMQKVGVRDAIADTSPSNTVCPFP
jgi:hypothetical protein